MHGSKVGLNKRCQMTRNKETFSVLPAMLEFVLLPWSHLYMPSGHELFQSSVSVGQTLARLCFSHIGPVC